MPKLKKTLYIGIGGTGVASLLKIKKSFIDSYGEIPPMIGFLAIDTATAAYNQEVTSNTGRPIKLADNELLVCTVRNALPTYKTNQAIYDWVPPKNVGNLRNIAGAGAGAIRSNGRFIAYYNFKEIQNHISAAITKIHQYIPMESKYSVDTNRGGVEYPTTINVFASVAGGTGSGMLIDTLCLVNKTMNEMALQFRLYPWIVLPEIFRAMNTGPSMNNVLYNTYGAIRSLDYIQHLEPNQPVINFGYTTIDGPLFDYAFVINNMNRAGVTFDKLDDLIDVIAKSAFLPANRMGDEIDTPFDNIRHQQESHTYDIRNKKAWAASTGSAELVYDNQAVGRAYACSVIFQLCNSMLQSNTDGTAEANKFFDNEDVLIRENTGRDDVINYLLSPSPEYMLSIDESTDINDILGYIQNTSGDGVDNELGKKFRAKLDNVNRIFSEYIAAFLDKTANGCIGEALQFLRALKSQIGLCRDEMEKEMADFRELNAIPAQWEADLKGITASGIASFFGKRTNDDNVEALSQKLSQHVVNIREEKRRDWAIKFYNAFEDTVTKYENDFLKVENYLKNIGNIYSNKLQKEQQLASSTSKFQLFLHQSDVRNVSGYVLPDAIKGAFHQKFQSTLITWLSLASDSIDRQLWDFAEKTQPVQDALNVSIDSVLNGMEPDKVREYLEQLKVLASPLWSLDPKGYNNTNLTLDQFIIVGVGNRDTSVLVTSPEYSGFFDVNANKAKFASTYQNDRVYVLVVENLSPIYAVNNYSTYENDFKLKQESNYPMAAYLDEKLNSRILSENFLVTPVVQQDNVLQLWVWGFIFDYIHYDPETNYYWVRSKKHGDPIDRYRYNLNKQRDVAFDIFKTEKIYQEIESLLNEQISRHGNEEINKKIQQIKDDGAYLDMYSNLSPFERANLKEPKFKAVYNLMAKEIELMTN
ncbi:MAG: tubulin-like doman-containing protein [Bacteroidales bacterium]|nr:tubulin-like doman-containing protein [Bacteroidales bacterium]